MGITVMFPEGNERNKTRSKELGEADSKDLRSRPSDLSEMSGKDEDHQFYRGRGSDRKDP